jgi:cytochrome c553
MKKLPVSLLAFVALWSLAAASWAQDAKEGEKKAAMCIGCHGIPGYQASFPEIHKVPMISGQGAKYIAAALNEYQKGSRKHPTMRSIAATLNDKDIADLAAFYEQQPKVKTTAPKDVPEAPADVAALLKKSNCESCHGKNFSTPIDGSYPKIAGQHADYLFVALKAYQVTNNPNVGRGNAIMQGMVKPYTHAELKAIAKYLASLPTELHTEPQSRFR